MDIAILSLTRYHMSNMFSTNNKHLLKLLTLYNNAGQSTGHDQRQ